MRCRFLFGRARAGIEGHFKFICSGMNYNKSAKLGTTLCPGSDSALCAPRMYVPAGVASTGASAPFPREVWNAQLESYNDKGSRGLPNGVLFKDNSITNSMAKRAWATNLLYWFCFCCSCASYGRASGCCRSVH